MKGALRRKLSSSTGASLLLALLFLLLCSTVAASVLMAAVSNAGKLRSNQEEHQKYLALSSAVSLLCDELNAAEYTGHYLYAETTQPVYDGEGNETGTTTLRYLTQQDGSYTGALSPLLLAALDGLFGQEISGSPAVAGFNGVSVKPTAPLSFTLTLTPQTGTTLDSQPVSVTLTVVAESYAIELTAALDDYRLQAELTPSTTKPTLPPSLTAGGGIQSTDALKWKIGWITTMEGDDTT